MEKPRIACLAWGSLVWDAGELPVEAGWFEDGPCAPVEFTRQSSDGRITLVLDPTAAPKVLLWAMLRSSDLLTAMEALRARENMPSTGWRRRIGSWQVGEPAPALIPDLPNWATAHRVDAAVWTALGPRFCGEARPPSIGEVLDYLGRLPDGIQQRAREYVERAPWQIDTAYRRRMEEILGWLAQPGSQ